MNYLKWLLYFFSEAFQTIRNNLVTTSVTITTIAISLAVCGLFAGIFINLNNILGSMGSQIQVVAYMKDGLSDDAILNVKRDIAAMPEVDDLEYISKERAFSIFKNDVKGQKGILEGLDASPFPASFEVKVKKAYRNTAGMNGLVSKLKIIHGIEDVQYGREWVDKLFAFVRFIEMFALVIGSFILLATIFIVSNTIRLAIYARREEIEIMGLLGATNIFIKTPFLIEGIIEGCLGAIIAVGILYLTNLILVMKTPPLFISAIAMPFSISHFFLGFIVVGITLGLLGSSIALRKFVKN